MSEQALPDFDALWNYDDPAGTEMQFRELLPAAEASGDSAYLLELKTQIGRTLGLQRKFDEAHTLLDEVQSALDPTDPALRRARVRYLLERGRVFNSSKQKDRAEPLFLQSYEESVAAGLDTYAIDAAHMVAIVAVPDRQLEWNERALELCERPNDPRAARWKGSLYNNIGWTYHDLGRFDDALEMFQRGVSFREELGQEGPLRIAKWCVARCLRSLGRVEEALAMQQTLHEEAKALGDLDMYGLEELGECLHALGRTAEAKPWFARAHEAMSKDPWLVENEPARLQRIKELAN